jgi:hypothetical protein
VFWVTSPSTTQSQDAAPVSVDRQDPENGFLAWQDNAYEIDPDDMAAYERALKAEPRLKSVVRVVSALTEFVRPTDELCYGCTWETMIKPLISPLIGWGRGYPPKSAKDPRPEGVSWEIVNLAMS